MTQERLNFLRNQIGKDFFEGPSQLGNWMQGKLQKVEQGEIAMEYVVKKEMTNPVGMLHGGIICAMLDEAIGLTSYTLDITHFYPTVNLNVDYLSSVKEGDKVVVSTKVIRQGRHVIHIEGKLFSDEGKLLAKASSNLIKSHIEIK
ncbi:PaaI family thioesterase [Limibacter armeniacum]|uniref:PaaI family thioesterase n=1 Tax=Limibacter armeniacum TaxID=466084 RepID=UPI002FE4FFD2